VKLLPANHEQKNPAKPVSIRRAQTIQDYKDCEAVQLKAWGIDDTRELIPIYVLRPFNEKGGIVMNAYDEDARPVGTNITFVGTHQGKTILYSHITGVVPEFQNKGVGLSLKLRQQQFAIENGFDLVCWTYDPMQSLNNWFNLTKLGAISRTYYTNYYGEMPDRLNIGLETDRFLAEWWVQSPRVQTKMQLPSMKATSSNQGLKILNESVLKDGIRQPSGKIELSESGEGLLIEIPYSYEDIRKVDARILQVWRVETRKLFSNYFDSGYFATECIVDRKNRRSFVKLERGPLERLLQA